MAIASVDNRRAYAGDGTTVAFAFPPPFTAATDLLVLTRDAAGTETTKALGLDYTVTGAGAPGGGTVTMTTAPPSGTTLHIIRDVPPTQPVNLQNGGPLPSPTANRGFDRRAMVEQRLKERVDRALVLRETDTNGSGKFNAGGNTITNSAPGSDGSDIATVGQIGDTTLSEFATFLQGGTGAVGRTLRGRLREQISVVDFNAATGNSAAANTTAINAAIAAAQARRVREVYVPDGTFAANALTNVVGVKLVGPGKLLIGTGATQIKANSTADFYDSHYDGLEYLQRLHSHLAGAFSTRIALYGDSTVANVSVSDPRCTCQSVLIEAGYQSGAFNLNVYNRGVSGASLNQLNDPARGEYAALEADLADPDMDCLILKFMINDGAYGSPGDSLELFASNLDAVLTRIRTARNHVSLSVILVTGNTVNDYTNGRDQQWFEKAIPILRAKARQYKCAFVDVYSPFRDAVNAMGAAGGYMDDLGNNGIHIHPRNDMQVWIWDRVASIVFNRSTMRRSGYNAVRAYSGISGRTAIPASAPDDFGFGFSIYRCMAAQGWPMDGTLEVVRSPDGVVRQTIYDYRAGDAFGHIMMRTSDHVNNTWKRWNRKLVPLSFANGWSNYGSGWIATNCSISMDGYVQLEGLVAGGTTTSGTVIATLPPGYRPGGVCNFKILAGGGDVVVNISPDGNIVLAGAGSATWMSLCSIRFRAVN